MTATSGKLFEPTSMEIFEQVNTTAKEIFGTGAEIWTGFEKTNDSGENIVHSSTGEKAHIEPWTDNGNVDDQYQYRIRFFVRGSDVWHDGTGSWTRYSICESVSEEE